MPDPREPNPDWLGDWSIYRSLITQRFAVQRGIDAYEAQHPEWRGAPSLIERFAATLHSQGIDPGCPAYDVPVAALRAALDAA